MSVIHEFFEAKATPSYFSNPSITSSIESCERQVQDLTSRLDVPVITASEAKIGNVSTVLINDDNINQITPELVGSNSIAVTTVQRVSDLTSGEADLSEYLDRVCGISLYVRQGESDTWFHVLFITKAYLLTFYLNMVEGAGDKYKIIITDNII